MTSRLLSLALLMSLVACASREPWTPLFDGVTTAGWRSATQAEGVSPESWRVEDGALVSQATAGDLLSVSTFDDFELRFDWRVDEAANSGVFYGVDAAGEWLHHTGLEYQVLDNVGQAGRPGTEQAGAVYGIQAASGDHTRPAGQWNSGRIRVRAGVVVHSVNEHDVLTLDLRDPAFQERVAAGPLAAYAQAVATTAGGHIALQNYHGHRVAYRDLKVRRLTAAD
jgi:hypothetical protein